MQQSSEPPEEESGTKKPNIFQVIFSVLAAAFGVQSSKNRERDFKHGNYKVFAIAGILFTLLFLVTVVSIVQWVLAGQ